MMLNDPATYIELLEECEEGDGKERERWWIRNTPNCVNEIKFQTAEEKRQARAEASRRYRASHPEGVAAYGKKWREDHPEYQREWRRRKSNP